MALEEVNVCDDGVVRIQQLDLGLSNEITMGHMTRKVRSSNMFTLLYRPLELLLPGPITSTIHEVCCVS
jgi:hypothetical protein